MSLAVAVVAHPDRLDQAKRLTDALGAELVLDEYALGEWANHARALAWAAEQSASHALIVQDDAEPVSGFLHHAAEAIAHQPDGLIGFYVGRTRPRQAQVQRAVEHARRIRASWLEADTLLWGVATAVPTYDIPMLLEWAETSRLPYDERLGVWYRLQGVSVRYTWPSLVNHADGPSVIAGRPRTVPRRAWQVGRPARWSGPVVRIER